MKNPLQSDTSVPMKLSDGTIILMSVTNANEKHDGPVTAQSIMATSKKVFHAVKGLAQDIKDSLEEAKPDKATVEFSLELEKKGGDILSKICDVSGKGGIKITLEWDFSKRNEKSSDQGKIV